MAELDDVWIWSITCSTMSWKTPPGVKTPIFIYERMMKSRFGRFGCCLPDGRCDLFSNTILAI